MKRLSNYIKKCNKKKWYDFIWFYWKNKDGFHIIFTYKKIQIFFNKKISSFKTVQFLKHDYY